MKAMPVVVVVDSEAACGWPPVCLYLAVVQRHEPNHCTAQMDYEIVLFLPTERGQCGKRVTNIFLADLL